MPIDFLAFYGLRPGSFRVVVSDHMVFVERDGEPGRNVSFSRVLPAPYMAAPISEQHYAISPGENLPCALAAFGNVAVPVPAPTALCDRCPGAEPFERPKPGRSHTHDFQWDVQSDADAKMGCAKCGERRYVGG